MPKKLKSYEQLWKEANRVRGTLLGESFPIEDLHEWRRTIIRLVNVVLDLIEKLVDRQVKLTRLRH